MLVIVSSSLRRAARMMDKESWADQSESPYQNIGIYQQQTDPASPYDEVQLGPPSLYNDVNYKSLDDDDRIKKREDIRRQGERPEKDIFDTRLSPTQVTTLEDPKTDEQGKQRDNVLERGLEEAWEDLNRETWRSEGPGGQLVQ